jgi:MFS family permease
MTDLATGFWESIGVNRGVLALSVARMADAVGNSILFILIPLYVARIPSDIFHFPIPVLVGILISLYGIVNSAIQPFTGALSDRLGRRKLMIQMGLGLMMIGTLGFIPADRFAHLIILRIVQGIGVAITIPASMALMASITKKETRGGSMGTYSMLRMIGFACGPIIGGFLQVHFGFNAAFYAGAGFLFLAVALVHFWVKDAPVNNNAPKQRFRVFDRALMSPGVLAAAASTLIMAMAFSMVTTLENEFNTRLGINALGFSIAFSSLMIGRLVLQIPLGRLSDHVGRKPLILGGLILMAPATALLGEVTTMLQLTLLRVFQGIAAAGIAAPALAVVADLSKSGGEGRQMSIITMGFGIGMAIGPLIAGLLAVIFFELPFLTGGALSLVGVWIIFKYMPETIHGKWTVFKEKAQISAKDSPALKDNIGWEPDAQERT